MKNPSYDNDLHKCTNVLVTGVFGDCEEEECQVQWARHNAFLLYECGAFTTFVELLNMEVE